MEHFLTTSNLYDGMQPDIEKDGKDASYLIPKSSPIYPNKNNQDYILSSKMTVDYSIPVMSLKNASQNTITT